VRVPGAPTVDGATLVADSLRSRHLPPLTPCRSLAAEGLLEPEPAGPPSAVSSPGPAASRKASSEKRSRSVSVQGSTRIWEIRRRVRRHGDTKKMLTLHGLHLTPTMLCVGCHWVHDTFRHNQPYIHTPWHSPLACPGIRGTWHASLCIKVGTEVAHGTAIVAPRPCAWQLQSVVSQTLSHGVTYILWDVRQQLGTGERPGLNIQMASLFLRAAQLVCPGHKEQTRQHDRDKTTGDQGPTVGRIQNRLTAVTSSSEQYNGGVKKGLRRQIGVPSLP
jgi:hypothetical protein